MRRNEFLEEALKNEIKVPLKCLKFLFLGPPRAGKSTFLQRLIGRITELNFEVEQPSTNLAESTDAVIRVCADSDKAEGIAATINEAEWCALGDKDSDKCKALDEEALMLYHFIEQTNMEILQEQVEKLQPNPGPFQQSTSKKADKVVKKEDEDVVQDLARQSSVPNTVNPTEVQVAQKVHEDPDLEKLFSSWHKLLSEHKVDEITKICRGTVLVNMIDIGGQPPFLEMSPLLTMGSALYLVFFDLRHELHEQRKVRYVLDSSVTRPIHSIKGPSQNESFDLPYSYSTTEVVFQILSSIACFNVEVEPAQLETILPPPTQSVSLVGTFLDEAGKETCSLREHQITAEVDYLDKIILGDEEQPYQKYLHRLDGKNYILAVNNAGGVDEISQHRMNLEKVIKDKFQEFPIPASWLMFSVLLRKLNKDVVSMKQCEQIAARAFVKVTDLKHVLWFLHHRTGVIMYFDEVKELQDIVICNPAVIFDCISDLILKTFLPSKCYDPKVRDKFWNYGHFLYDDVKSATTCLNAEGVIALLNHLNILVEVNMSSKRAYFMHAVLQPASDVELNQLIKHNEKVSPVIIRFKSGFVPVGCFSALISFILKSKEVSRWTWDLQTENQLFKNKLTFLFAGSFEVILVSRVKYYEVHVNPVVEQSDYKLSLWEACHLVLKRICGALDSVLLQLKQKYMYTSCDDLTKYQIGFLCSRVECQNSLDKQLELGDHFMVVNSGHQLELNQCCTCLRTNKNIRLKHEHHLVWSGQVCRI